MVFCWEPLVALSSRNRSWLCGFRWIIYCLVLVLRLLAATTTQTWEEGASCEGQIVVMRRGYEEPRSQTEARLCCSRRGWRRHARMHAHTHAPGNQTLTDDESDAHEEQDHSEDQATNSQRLVIWKEKKQKEKNKISLDPWTLLTWWDWRGWRFSLVDLWGDTFPLLVG